MVGSREAFQNAGGLIDLERSPGGNSTGRHGWVYAVATIHPDPLKGERPFKLMACNISR